MSGTTQNKKPGPDPDHLKIDGDWEDVLKEVLEKKRPKEGWPKLEETDDDPDPVEKADD